MGEKYTDIVNETFANVTQKLSIEKEELSLDCRDNNSDSTHINGNIIYCYTNEIKEDVKIIINIENGKANDLGAIEGCGIHDEKYDEVFKFVTTMLLLHEIGHYKNKNGILPKKDEYLADEYQLTHIYDFYNKEDSTTKLIINFYFAMLCRSIGTDDLHPYTILRLGRMACIIKLKSNKLEYVNHLLSMLYPSVSQRKN